MKRNSLLVAAGLATLLVTSFGLPNDARATTTVTYQGMSTQQFVSIYRDGYLHNTYAGEMSLDILGVDYPAYCVDLDHYIYNNLSYQADLIPAPAESPWCEISYIVTHHQATDDVSGAAIQVALWKLVYGPDNLYVTQSAVEAEAEALIAEASGACPLLCQAPVTLDLNPWADADGYLHVTITLLQNGSPVPDQPVTVATTSGQILEGANFTTDVNGSAFATVDLVGATLPITITAQAVGQDITIVDPVDPYQTLVSFFIEDPCEHTGSATFSASVFGNPRTIGFWKHQIKVATGGKGNAQVDPTTLASYLPLDVFGTTISTLGALSNALWPDNKTATMPDRALQQCSATLLNFHHGQLGWFTQLDFDGDGVDDDYFVTYWQNAQAAYAAGSYEVAKTICDTINNL